MADNRSSTWPTCTIARAGTPTRRGSTSARWSIKERALGADHPGVAETLGNLANVYDSQGKYADAEGLYKRALAIFEKAFGADHPDVAMALQNLAGVYENARQVRRRGGAQQARAGDRGEGAR